MDIKDVVILCGCHEMNTDDCRVFKKEAYLPDEDLVVGIVNETSDLMKLNEMQRELRTEYSLAISGINLTSDKIEKEIKRYLSAKDRLKVYLSAGWFNEFEEKALNFLIENISIRPDIYLYCPKIECALLGNEGNNVGKSIFLENCIQIFNSDIVISSTVGKDMGTIWENGFACAFDRPVIYTMFDERFPDAIFNLMLAQSGNAAFTDKQKFLDFLANLNKDNFYDLKEEYKGDFE